MSRTGSSRSNKNTNRIGTITSTFVAFSVAAFVASGVSYGAKPPTTTGLNATVCANLSGSSSNWLNNTCTIPAGTDATLASGVKITNGVTLDIRGSLTVPPGLILANSGTIIVENTGGVVPPYDGLETSNPAHGDWQTGLLLLGTLDNSGAITIQNQSATNTDLHGATGITISVTSSQILDPNSPDWPNFKVFPGTLTNSGTINILNGVNNARTRGIENLGSLTNSGTIAVANRGAAGVGIYNMRYRVSLDAQYYIVGTLTNTGTIQITSTGPSLPPDAANPDQQYGYGIYNNGHFTNSKTFAIEANPSEGDDGRGLYNSGTFINYAAFTNKRGSYSSDAATVTWGSWNVGTMINYGNTLVGELVDGNPSETGTFYNEALMLNFSSILNYGWFDDHGYMLNYGTFDNFGHVDGGANQAICIDEPGSDGGCG